MPIDPHHQCPFCGGLYSAESIASWERDGIHAPYSHDRQDCIAILRQRVELLDVAIAAINESRTQYVLATHGFAFSCRNGHVIDEPEPGLTCSICGEPVYFRPVPIEQIPASLRGKVIIGKK